MSLLWSDSNTKLSTILQNPSPTYQINFFGSARNRGIQRHDKCISRTVKNHFIKGSSLFILLEKKVKASMTVEAAVVLPLFLFFFLNLGSVVEMIRFHGNMQLALWDVGNELAICAYVEESKKTAADKEVTVAEGAGEESSGEVAEAEREEAAWWWKLGEIAFTQSYVKNRLLQSLGELYVDNSPVVYGSDGLSLWESDVVNANGEIEMIVTYGVKAPFGLVAFRETRMANHYFAHGWNGYEIPVGSRIVYVAQNGVVYHLSEECTYLKLTVRKIGREELQMERNQSGARYVPCEKCAKEDIPEEVYITKEGDCYHYIQECSGLKRTVLQMWLEEVEDLRLCSRCGKSGKK